MWRSYPPVVPGKKGINRRDFTVIPTIPIPYDNNDIFSSFK
jgi:hypothetical protein